MNTPKLINESVTDFIETINLDQLIEEAASDYRKEEICLVLFGTASQYASRIENLKLEYFTCNDLAGFFALGLDRYAAILIFNEEPAECSLDNLNTLLETRSNLPREIVTLIDSPEENLEQTLLSAYERVQRVSSIENKIWQLSQDAHYPESRTGSGLGTPKRNLRLTQDLIRARVIDKINQAPEEFLKEAISNIRK